MLRHAPLENTLSCFTFFFVAWTHIISGFGRIARSLRNAVRPPIEETLSVLTDLIRAGKVRTMEQLDDLLAGVEVRLDDGLLNRIDEIVPPGVDIAPLEGAPYVPPAIARLELRRRPANERAAV
jgi:hypothetical protein